MLTDAEANLSLFVGMVFTTGPAEVLLEDGETVAQAGVTLQVLHTPGHTPGGICLYAQQEGLVFAGDTLFAGSVGRTDFPGGDMDQLIEGIRTKLFTLPDATVVYPGHGMRTTIGREKRNNPYVRG
jgi:glyoxylase-like metal-dependent hydrolase (beta-lactamase superfamily II)